MDEDVEFSCNDADIERKAYEIVKELFRGMHIPIEEEEGDEEEEGSVITRTNLRNMLEAARDAKRKGSWDIFKLKVIYIARRAESGDSLYTFVQKLLRLISKSESDERKRLELAERTMVAAIYMFNALRKGFGGIIYNRG